METKLYEILTSMHGGSGSEAEVREFMEKNLTGASEILRDGFGGVFGKYPGSGDVNIMICAHMDEISCMITEIRNDGFMKIMPVGGINVEVMVSCNVIVHARKKGKKKEIRGVISSIPPHISKDNKLTFDDIVLDIGCDSKEEVEALGITIGTYVTPVPEFYLTENKEKMVNKAFDDRLGCAVVLELAKEIKDMDHPNNIYLGGTVEEEVGLRGGQVSSQMIKPDLFITVDVSPTSDYLGKPEMGALGKGFLIRYFDPRNIMPIKLREYFVSLSEKHDIPYQLFKSGGGTDAGAAQYVGKGILATTVGVPGRYILSPATMVSLKDIESAKRFILELVKDFDRKRLEELHK